MAISLVGSASAKVEGTGNVTVTFPGGVLQDDLVIVNQTNARTTDQAMSLVSTGYTNRADLYSNDNNDVNMGVWTKFMGAIPDTNVVVTGSGSGTNFSAAQVQIWRGVDTTTPMDATPTTATGTNTDVPDPPSITTVTANAQVIALGGTTVGTTAPTITAPSGYTNLTSQTADVSGSGFWTGVMMASKTVASPGAENPGTFGGMSGLTTEAWAAVTLALRPAVVAPASMPPHNNNQLKPYLAM